MVPEKGTWVLGSDVQFASKSGEGSSIDGMSVGCAEEYCIQVSVQAGDVKRVLHNFSIEVDASEKGDLEEEKVVKRLRSVSLLPPPLLSY